jgi:hypothetical protein
MMFARWPPCRPATSRTRPAMRRQRRPHDLATTTMLCGTLLTEISGRNRLGFSIRYFPVSAFHDSSSVSCLSLRLPSWFSRALAASHDRQPHAVSCRPRGGVEKSGLNAAEEENEKCEPYPPMIMSRHAAGPSGRPAIPHRKAGWSRDRAAAHCHPHTPRIASRYRSFHQRERLMSQLIANMLDAVVSPASTGRIEREHENAGISPEEIPWGFHSRHKHAGIRPELQPG